jgi:hypothetical protein
MIATPRDTPDPVPSRKVGQSHRNLAVDTLRAPPGFLVGALTAPGLTLTKQNRRPGRVRDGASQARTRSPRLVRAWLVSLGDDPAILGSSSRAGVRLATRVLPLRPRP